MSRARERATLCGILAFALLLRLSGIGYGLPLHLFGDEETNVLAALELGRLHSLIPALHTSALRGTLYEPPLLTMCYVLLFAPFEILVGGATRVAEHLSSFWLLARAFNALVSTGTVYLVYCIGRRLFSGPVGLAAAAFLATSWIDVTIASTARHWSLGTFFGVLGLFLLLHSYASARHQYVLRIAAGAALGASFAASYFVFYLPLVALHLLYRADRLRGEASLFAALTNKILIIDACLVFGSCAATAFAGYLLYTPALAAQLLVHMYGMSLAGLWHFVRFYTGTLWYLELPLALFALVGCCRLGRRFAIVLPAGALLALVMYVFLLPMSRFLMPFLPLLALVAGYGFVDTMPRLPRRRVLAPALCAVLLCYGLAVYSRYEVLVWGSDTRTALASWMHEHMPPGTSALFLVGSDSTRFAYGVVLAPDGHSLGRVAPDKALASGAVQYLIREQWGPPPGAGAPRVFGMASSTAPLFARQSAGKDMAHKFFIGGDYDGSGTPLLALLYGVDQLGPDIWVYQLAAPSNSKQTEFIQ